MKIALILGTRPEIIKLSPIIRECQKQDLDFFILHTNQHYSTGMDQLFFQELALPSPRYNLDVHDYSPSVMVGKMLIGLEPILQQEKPDWVIIQGDTNTVLAGALSASKLGIKVGHVEAGLRSYDRSMPEEINRIVADHLADTLFCPTSLTAQNAVGEGISPAKVIVTGNTIVDAVHQNLELAKKSKIANKYSSKSYLLLTMHRPSNVDTPEALSLAIHSLESLSSELKLPIIFPVHPRTSLALKRFAIVPDATKIQIIDPVGYLEMLLLMEKAKLIITDSGGIQEEACILHVPCLTIRNNTERPETVDIGANLVVGTSKTTIIRGAKAMLKKSKNWMSPFGDGHAAEKVISVLLDSLNPNT